MFPTDKLTYFSRHTEALDIDSATRDRLWKEKRIAIHYPWLDQHAKATPKDSRSLDSSDYRDTSSKKAINAIVRLAGSGGYVCARYSGQSDFLVGYVKEGSEIEIFEGRWGERSFGKEGLDRVAVLKTLRLEGDKVVKPTSHGALMVARPRQGTLMRWPSAGDAIKHLVNGTKAAPSLAALDATQQEVMCSEFLRADHDWVGIPKVVHLLLPVGRTMEDFDIVGMTAKGKRVLAQVTFAHADSPTCAWKLDRLKIHEGKSVHLVLFCQAEKVEIRRGIMIVPLHLVYQSFIKTEFGKTWVALST